MSCNREVRPRRHCGITLAEVIVVLAIIAMLIALLMPALSVSREVARTMKCNTQLRQMGHYYSLYLTDNRNMLPSRYVYANDIHRDSVGPCFTWTSNYSGGFATMYSGTHGGGVFRDYFQIKSVLETGSYSGLTFCPTNPMGSIEPRIQDSYTHTTYQLNPLIHSQQGHPDRIVQTTNYSKHSWNPATPATKRAVTSQRVLSPHSQLAVFADSYIFMAPLRFETVYAHGSAAFRDANGNPVGNFSPRNPTNPNAGIGSFHHGGAMNYVFLDGHCESLTFNQMNTRYQHMPNSHNYGVFGYELHAP